MRWALGLLVIAACSEHGSGGPPIKNIDAPIGPPGGACGGFGGKACGPTEFCDLGTNSCGTSDESGVCLPRPMGCPDLLVPDFVCGCDGQVHTSECDANAAGVDVDAQGRCMVPPGRFACGFRQCMLETQYCEEQISDIGGQGNTFTCKPMPTCPGPANCSCLAQQPCGASCTGSAAKGFRLTCAGG
ncbi:MAG: hypothetical protein KF773_42475 [Deltaproteobacteria bacterium]|nr:hypothetical protein [Deltaproteobacteria bacterium]MCW5804894.1 hypothetical protein [Deltaproteobacteria bacterium]